MTSTGPRTGAGKVRSSFNALRHGLAAIHRRQPAPAGAVQRLALAICGGDDNAEILDAARAIAENSFVLSAIRQQKIIVIERLKDATAIALRKGDNSFTLAKARFMEAWLADREIQKMAPHLMKKYRIDTPPRVLAGDLIPIQIKVLLEEPTEEEEERAAELARKQIKRQQRNECDAVEEAIPDLIRLERYERRAWSRQQRAIQEFVLIKFNRAMSAARGQT